jgi:crotonobetainyl-CoA:carnitine CoA-transferase CaiB-like acyl-CoA transferase
VGSDGQWRKLTALPGFGALSREGRATNEGRKADREAIHREVAALTCGMETAPLVAALTAAGLVACKVQEVPEVLEEPWLTGSLKGTSLPGGRRVRLQPSAVDREGEPMELGPPPAYGQDTARILHEIGAGEDEIRRWREAGILFTGL